MKDSVLYKVYMKDSVLYKVDMKDSVLYKVDMKDSVLYKVDMNNPLPQISHTVCVMVKAFAIFKVQRLSLLISLHY